MKKMSDYIDLLDMKIYSENDLKSALNDSNFIDINIFKKNEGNNWICAIATKKRMKINNS
ncbi:hypothetical protein [Methanobrevibacter arboriphilus]|uniref:hypothetical protein n=1 Tax=Methanobrevibacter arboriphilus TaxID=39441 RepID=UPI001CDAF1E9|nr:hypothetical protein [Methanobrevibacter arboriphilus]